MITYNGNILTTSTGKWYTLDRRLPPIPLNTIRLRYKAGVTPHFTLGTGVCIDSIRNIWDLTYNNTDWSWLVHGDTNVIEVLGSNSPNVTSIYHAFNECSSLKSITMDTSNVTNIALAFCRTGLIYTPNIDTSKVVEATEPFYECYSLKEIRYLNTSNMQHVNFMFYLCANVETGMYELYQQMSNQAIPPTDHVAAFGQCGKNTESGRAERALIPRSWGGDLD